MSAARILLVEDHPGYARLVELTLEAALQEDDEIIHASDWAEARRELGDGRPTCVLLDLALPDEAGAYLVDLVTELAPGVPVIVLSGRETEGLEADLCARGAVAFVRKDDVQAQLVPVVRAALAT